MIKIEFHNCLTGLYKEWFFKDNNPRYSELLKAIDNARKWDDEHKIRITGGIYIDAAEGNCNYVTSIKDLDTPDFKWIRLKIINKEYHNW